MEKERIRAEKMSKPRTNQEIIEDELQDIPEAMRERVRRLIEKRVQWRVD